MSWTGIRNPTGLTADELATRDARREEICTAMLTGAWRGSSSRRQLAKDWGLALAEVFRLEGEAAGAVRQLRKQGWADEADAIREGKYAELDELIVLARKAVKHHVVGGELVAVDTPEVGVMLKAIKLQLEIMGAMKRPGDKLAPSADDYDRLSVSEKRAVLEEAMRELESHNDTRH